MWGPTRNDKVIHYNIKMAFTNDNTHEIQLLLLVNVTGRLIDALVKEVFSKRCRGKTNKNLVRNS